MNILSFMTNYNHTPFAQLGFHAIVEQRGNKDGLSASTEFLVNAISAHSSAPRGSSTLTGVAYIEPPVPLKASSGSKLMRLLFSGRNAKLETMNRILTEAAQKRTERIEELERRVAQLERELEPARKVSERAKELEVVAAERAHLLNEKDKQLADVREAATKYYFRIQELERTLAQMGQK